MAVVRVLPLKDKGAHGTHASTAREGCRSLDKHYRLCPQARSMQIYGLFLVFRGFSAPRCISLTANRHLSVLVYALEDSTALQAPRLNQLSALKVTFAPVAVPYHGSVQVGRTLTSPAFGARVSVSGARVARAARPAQPCRLLVRRAPYSLRAVNLNASLARAAPSSRSAMRLAVSCAEWARSAPLVLLLHCRVPWERTRTRPTLQAPRSAH